MNERLALNNDPINQLARGLLVEAEEYPAPDHLYVLQLMMWALEQDPSALNQAPREALDSLTNTLIAGPPADAMKFLFRTLDSPEPERETMLHPDNLEPDPLEAAIQLLDLAATQLTARFPEALPRPR